MDDTIARYLAIVGQLEEGVSTARGYVHGQSEREGRLSGNLGGGEDQKFLLFGKRWD